MAFTNGKQLSLLEQLALQCVDDSKRWFPEQHHSIPHHTLALCGEVGELANLIKKIERGSLDFSNQTVRYDVAMEITDIFIYLLNLAGLLRINLEASYNVKRRENEQRFSAKPAGSNGVSK